MNREAGRPASLPPAVIARDRELDARYQEARGELAQHRWNWTLNPDNPGAVSIREYARQVERDRQVIQSHARGYAIWVERGGGVTPPPVGRALSLDDAIELARMGEERRTVAELLSRRFNVGIQTLRKRYRNHVENVLHAARTRAEEEGTSFSEEVGDVVRGIAPELFTGEKRQQPGLGLKPNPVSDCERRLTASRAHVRAIADELLFAVLELASEEQLRYFASEAEEISELWRELAVSLATRTIEETT